ncbi:MULTISPECIES: metal-dependent hydrolase [unclassified Legionella]|uniref:metal-dependent hydrolase n=1 Tax=unclassified Legionella TaxID=2622702 RepID=UPI001054FC94|nr:MULTISPECIES: metal-dependent hydrolase [unclassified Legionella]MDI9817835.1 metal-dependent hydrolase [Legionella sp. PL877]
MDPITQGALGAACAQAVLHNQDRRNAWIAGGLAGMAADLDILINSPHDPLLFLLYHRHFSHSLFFIPVGGTLVALALMIFKRFRPHWQFTFLASLIGYATHGLLDAFTHYGTVLYWPFTDKRVSWDIISIIDPFFTIPLLLGITWTIINKKRLGVLIGLAIAGLFLLFNTVQHHRAILAAQTFFEKKHWQTNRLRVFPKLASSTSWRGIATRNQRFLALNVSVPLTEPAHASLVADYPLLKGTEIPDYVRNSPTLLRDLAVFNWFCDGYLILVNKLPLTLADGRFLLGENPAIALWGIQFLPDAQHVRKLNLINIG